MFKNNQSFEESDLISEVIYFSDWNFPKELLKDSTAIYFKNWNSLKSSDDVFNVDKYPIFLWVDVDGGGILEEIPIRKVDAFT